MSFARLHYNIPASISPFPNVYQGPFIFISPNKFVYIRVDFLVIHATTSYLFLMEDWHQFKFLPKMKVSACIGKIKGLFGTQHLSSLVHLWQLLGKPRKTNGLSKQPMQQQQHSLKEEMTRTALKNDSHFFSWKKIWPPRQHNTNGMWFLTISFFNVWKEYWILRRGQKPSIGTPRFIEKQIIS